MNNKTLYTFSGFIAICLWSTIPIVSLVIEGVSNFLSLGIAYLTAFLMFVIYWVVKYKGSILKNIKKQPPGYIALNFLATLPAHITFVYAIQLGNPIDCYIIINAWPIFALFLSAYLWKEKLTKLDLIGAALGLAGVIMMGMRDAGALADNATLGVLFACVNVVIWSFFSVYIRKYENTSSDFIGLSFGMGAALALFLYWLIPSQEMQVTNSQYLAMLYFGLLPCGLACFIWNAAMKKGNMNMLILLGYNMPLLGVIWLCALGYSQFDYKIGLAMFLIIVGSNLKRLVLWRKK